MCPPVPAPLVKASLGFVLPTIAVWTAQLRAARKYAEQYPGTDAARQLRASQYERVVAPLLDVATGSIGGAAVPTVLAALGGYLASVFARQYLFDA